MAYRTPTRCCSERDIYNFYKWIDVGRYDKAIKMLMARNIFVLVKGKDYFKNSDQARGVFVFTDIDRVSRFLAQDENADPAVFFEQVPFLPTWLRVETLDIYVNLTPKGCKDAFLHWCCAEDNWYLSSKDKYGRYTLPYGLTPHYSVTFTDDNPAPRIPGGRG